MADSIKVFPPGWRAEDDNGIVIGSGKLEFFAAGTSDHLTVYSDKDLSVSLGATVYLTAGGYPKASGGSRVLVYTGTNPYRVRLKDSNDVAVWEHDDVKGALDTGDFDDLIASQFAPGTSMLFMQTNAPVGWTKSVAHDDAAVRIVSDTASFGGSLDFTTAFAARTITQANLPSVNLSGTAAGSGSHRHFVAATGSNSSTLSDTNALVRQGSNYTLNGTGAAAAVGQTNVVSDHTHDATSALGGSGSAMSFAVKYVDAIIAVKD